MLLMAEKRTAQGKARLYASAGRDFTCRVDKLWRGQVVESIVFANHVDAREAYDALT